MFISNAGQFSQTGPRGRPPELLFGKDAPGTESWLKRAKRSSLYFRVDEGNSIFAIYMKTGTAGTAADWVVQFSNSSTGFLPVPLTTLREIFTNDIGVAADGAAQGSGGILATDTTPALEYANGDTDSQIRVLWAAGNVDKVAFQMPLPDDLGAGSDITLMVRGEMGGATDTPTLTVETFFNEGDTKVSDTSAAFTDAVGEFATTIAAADVPSGARTMSVEITPGAHATDTLILYAVWLEYKKK